MNSVCPRAFHTTAAHRMSHTFTGPPWHWPINWHITILKFGLKISLNSFYHQTCIYRHKLKEFFKRNNQQKQKRKKLKLTGIFQREGWQHRSHGRQAQRRSQDQHVAFKVGSWLQTNSQLDQIIPVLEMLSLPWPRIPRVARWVWKRPKSCWPILAGASALPRLCPHHAAPERAGGEQQDHHGERGVDVCVSLGGI